MSDNKTIAVEGLFDPEATTEKLLAAVKENITNKITTVDQAADLENRLSEEAAEFNAMLSTISNAMRQCQAGEITKEECKAAAEPCVKALKERCKALELADVKVAEDDITENEIAMLREYIVGCKDIVAAHKEALQDCPIAQNEENASEGVMSFIDGLDVATESANAKLLRNVRNSSEAKAATALYKNAKKLYQMGSKDKAKTYMEQAKAKYQKCLDDARKVTGEKKIQIEKKMRDLDGERVTATIKGYNAYDTENGYRIVAYFEDRVDTCEAYLRQWSNKAGNKDLKETKEQLKAERKEEKARIRAEKKAAREKAAAESALIDEQISALESMMDGYELDLVLEAAMESEGAEAPASKASEIGAKLRAAFGKLKDAFKKGDKKAAEEANAEVKAAAGELDSAASGADEEGKKKLSTAAKIGIAAAAVAVLVAGDVALGQALRKKAGETGAADLKGLGAMIVKSSDAIVKKVGSAAMKVEKKQIQSAAKTIAAAGKEGGAKAIKAGEKLAKAGAAYKKNKALLGEIQKTEAIMNAAKANRKGMDPSTFKSLTNRVKMILGKMDTADAKIKELKAAADALQKKADEQFAAGNKEGAGVLYTELGNIMKQLNHLELGTESYTALEGASFLSYLAMEEANFSDEVPLSEIEEEEGRGFDADAQGEDMVDEAKVGAADESDDEDEECDDEECEESVLESALAIFKLEDGLDPDED